MKIFEKIQDPYIYLLNYLYRFIDKIGIKQRDIIAEISLFAILSPIYDAIFGIGLTKIAQIRPFLLFFFTLIAALFSMTGRVRRVSVNPVMVSLYLIYSLSLAFALGLNLITGQGIGVPTRLFTAISMYLIALPLMFIVWANRGDFENLYKRFIRLYVCAFAVYALLLFRLGKWMPVSGEYRFSGTTDHPNALGMMLACGGVCALYLLITERLRPISIVYGLAFCLSGFFLMLTASRTSEIAVIGAALALLVYLTVKKQKRSAVITLIACAAFAVSFFAAKPYYTHELSRVLEENAVASAASSSASSSGVSISESGSELSASQDAAGDSNPGTGSFSKTDENEALKEKRMSLAGKDLNGILNNRPIIWGFFLKNLNLFGTDYWKRYSAATEFGAAHAHNYFIHTAFWNGAIVGAFSLLIALGGLFYTALCVLGRKPYTSHRMFTIAVICVFLMFSITESISTPLNSDILYLYAFAQIPVFCTKFFPEKNKLNVEPDKR